MKNLTAVLVVLLVPWVLMGCGLTKAQRIELVDGLTKTLTEKVSEKLVPKIEKVAAKAVKEGIEELNLSPEAAKKLEDAANNAIRSKLKDLVEEELKPAIRKVVDDIVPEADSETSGVGKALSGLLSTAVFGLLGIKTA